GRVGIITLAQARAEAKLRLAEKNPCKEQPQTIRWTDAKDEYLAERKSKLRPRTYNGYAYYLNRTFKYGATKLTDITPYDLSDSMAKLDRVPVSQQHAFRTIRAFMRWA